MRLWLVYVGKVSCLVGPCKLEDMLELLKLWVHSGDNRDGSFGYQPAELS